jgi:hypothetical protein
MPYDPLDPRRDRDPREPTDDPKREEPEDDPVEDPLEQPPIHDPGEIPEDEPARRDPDPREPARQVQFSRSKNPGEAGWPLRGRDLLLRLTPAGWDSLGAVPPASA